jgi:hypothetical protein
LCRRGGLARGRFRGGPPPERDAESRRKLRTVRGFASRRFGIAVLITGFVAVRNAFIFCRAIPERTACIFAGTLPLASAPTLGPDTCSVNGFCVPSASETASASPTAAVSPVPSGAQPKPSPPSAAPANGETTAADVVPTSVTVAADPEPSYVGDPVTIDATVAPAPDGGTITWTEDGVEVGTTPVGGDGRASIERVPTAAGSHVYRAAFSGTAAYGASVSEPHSHVVNLIAQTTITFDPVTVRAVADTEVSVTATVAPAPPTGSVTWSLGGGVFATTPLDGVGKTTVTLRVPLGPSRVKAIFAGTPGFSPSAAETDVEGVTVPWACEEPLRIARSVGATADHIRAGRISFFGITASVDPRTVDYAHSPIANASWAGYFRGLLFIAPLAVDAYISGDLGGMSLVTAYVNAYRRNPDPGSSTPQRLALAGATGWDEATNAGREKVLNCLIQIDPGPAVSWLLDASIVANLDMNRYYGPPKHRTHNHGMMANLALIESARILRRPSLIDVAERRILVDATLVMDPCGMVFEQSAPYQKHNAVIWAQAAAKLDQVGRPLTAARLRGTARKMADAFDQLIAPDGRLPAIGDGNDTMASPLRSPTTTRMLCRSAGWAVARGGWTPSTTWSVIRFGPPRIQHGHNDHGSIVWYRGRHVLVDPGFYYEPNSAYGRWYKTNAAHNVLAASGLESSGGTALVRSSQGTTVDTYTLRDVTPYLTRTRSIRVDRGLPLLVVLDRASSGRPRTFSQLWHFDPAWRWDSTQRQLVATGARTGVVSMDLRTRRGIPATATSSWVFRPPRRSDVPRC